MVRKRCENISRDEILSPAKNSFPSRNQNIFSFQFKLVKNSVGHRGIATTVQRRGKPINLDTLPPNSRAIIKRENEVTCQNYAALPAVLQKGQGVHLWDVDGNKYFDYLSGYSSVNQGHCHPKIIKALVDQVSVLHHTSRAFHSNLLCEYAEFITKLFGYVSELDEMKCEETN
jgi:Aminotransferase class-III